MTEQKADIYIERTNASKITLYLEDEGINYEIYETFQYKEPTFTRNKYSKWNGQVRMYNKSSGVLPYGCLQTLLLLANTRGWKVELDPRFKEDLTNVEMSDLDDWVDTLNLHSSGNKITPYDYQMEGLRLAIKYGRMTLLAATSAGKSLLIYMLTRYYYDLLMKDNEKILIIVPSINLVSQMIGDFRDYSSHNGWKPDSHVHLIAEGSPKFSNKKIYISTWQSIHEMPTDYFEQFGYIIEDEVHGASGKSIGKILTGATNAYKRIGLTGTLKNEKIHSMQVQSLFGPIKRIVSTRELIASGRATPTQITMLQLDYSEFERNLVSTMSYQQELEFMIGHAYRSKITENLALGLKGNTLVLFQRKDSHLYKVYDNLKGKGKKVYVIEGGITNTERDEIKRCVEREEDVILLATLGTMSTGVSIKKLHNLIFAHPSKSLINTLQSIGRLLRLHGCKELANIYDIVDDLYFDGRPNYVLNHAKERLGFYKDEEHPIKIKKIQMKNHEDCVKPIDMFE